MGLENGNMLKGDDRFVARVATWNSIAFCFVATGVTYVDARLTSHIVYGSREYLFGYWICILGPVIGLTTWHVTRRMHSWTKKAATPAALLMLAGFISLPVFASPFPHGEFPHGMIAAALLEIGLVSLLTCIVHFIPLRHEWLASTVLGRDVKIERIKELSQFWRTLAFSMAFGYMALIVPWVKDVVDSAAVLAPKTDEAFLLSRFSVAVLTVVSVYVVGGLVMEALLKAHQAADLLLSLPVEVKE
jgi:hypothetical protein